jgi:hypothetical protein
MFDDTGAFNEFFGFLWLSDSTKMEPGTWRFSLDRRIADSQLQATGREGAPWLGR